MMDILKISIGKALSSTSKVLMKDFKPRYGGFLHFAHKKIILQHYKLLPNTILGGILTSPLPAIFVTDRSYIYIYTQKIAISFSFNVGPTVCINIGRGRL